MNACVATHHACVLCSGVRLDRVRGGRQKYKRRMMSPLPNSMSQSSIKKEAIQAHIQSEYTDVEQDSNSIELGHGTRSK